MKKITLNLFIIAAVSLASIACKSDKKNETQTKAAEEVAEKSTDAQKFVINTKQSEIEWKGSKPAGEHIGSIGIKSGVLFFNNEQLESGKIVIDMTSITVKDEDLSEEKKKMLEGHLKGTAKGKESDFFDTKKYPTASFEITNIKGSGEKMELEGNLTMKGQTHNVTFPVRISWASDRSSVKLFSEPFKIDRTKWGVNYGSKTVFDDLGDNWVNDAIQLSIAVKAHK